MLRQAMNLCNIWDVYDVSDYIKDLICAPWPILDRPEVYLDLIVAATDFLLIKKLGFPVQIYEKLLDFFDILVKKKSDAFIFCSGFRAIIKLVMNGLVSGGNEKDFSSKCIILIEKNLSVLLGGCQEKNVTEDVLVTIEEAILALNHYKIICHTHVKAIEFLKNYAFKNFNEPKFKIDLRLDHILHDILQIIRVKDFKFSLIGGRDRKKLYIKTFEDFQQEIASFLMKNFLEEVFCIDKKITSSLKSHDSVFDISVIESSEKKLKSIFSFGKKSISFSEKYTEKLLAAGDQLILYAVALLERRREKIAPVSFISPEIKLSSKLIMLIYWILLEQKKLTSDSQALDSMIIKVKYLCTISMLRNKLQLTVEVDGNNKNSLMNTNEINDLIMKIIEVSVYPLKGSLNKFENAFIELLLKELTDLLFINPVWKKYQESNWYRLAQKTSSDQNKLEVEKQAFFVLLLEKIKQNDPDYSKEGLQSLRSLLETVKNLRTLFLKKNDIDVSLQFSVLLCSLIPCVDLLIKECSSMPTPSIAAVVMTPTPSVVQDQNKPEAIFSGNNDVLNSVADSLCGHSPLRQPILYNDCNILDFDDFFTKDNFALDVLRFSQLGKSFKYGLPLLAQFIFDFDKKSPLSLMLVNSLNDEFLYGNMPNNLFFNEASVVKLQYQHHADGINILVFLLIQLFKFTMNFEIVKDNHVLQEMANEILKLDFALIRTIKIPENFSTLSYKDCLENAEKILSVLIDAGCDIFIDMYKDFLAEIESLRKKSANPSAQSAYLQKKLETVFESQLTLNPVAKVTSAAHAAVPLNSQLDESKQNLLSSSVSPSMSLQESVKGLPSNIPSIPINTQQETDIQKVLNEWGIAVNQSVKAAGTLVHQNTSSFSGQDVSKFFISSMGNSDIKQKQDSSDMSEKLPDHRPPPGF
jgi:hypothetical protein